MIKITGVDKSFDEFKALTDLDLNVKKGSIYGLVGVNGYEVTQPIYFNPNEVPDFIINHFK